MSPPAGSPARSAPDALERLAAAVLGVYLLGVGASHVVAGHVVYTDWIGLKVPSLVALPLGVLLLVVARRGMGHAGR